MAFGHLDSALLKRSIPAPGTICCCSSNHYLVFLHQLDISVIKLDNWQLPIGNATALLYKELV